LIAGYLIVLLRPPNLVLNADRGAFVQKYGDVKAPMRGGKLTMNERFLTRGTR
jgi:hypothetical protein